MAKAKGKSRDQVEKILAKLKRDGIQHVRFELPDMHGSARSKQVPIEFFEQFARGGVNMYGGVIAVDSASHVVPGTRYNEEVNYRDQTLIPDFNSLMTVPWLENTACVICDTEWSSGDPLRAAPRYLMGEMLKRLDKLGLKAVMSHEFEFYMLDRETRQPFFDGIHIFNNLRNEQLPIIRQVVDYLRTAGIPMLTANAEYAPSQYELVYSHAEGMAGADNGYTFKNSVKEIVQQAGMMATFMSKPFAGSAGSGCHYHVSLLRKKGGQNVFIDNKKPDQMSDTMRHFVQGLIDHGGACMALFNPTPNCYRRLRPHTFAPSNISWGAEDRSAMVRIKSPGSKAMHVEMRAAASLSNPYLSAAGTLACGLLGMQEKRKLGRQSDGPSEEDSSLPPFPSSLDQALDMLEADKALCEMLGEEFVDIFTKMKRYELSRFHDHVSQWESDEYLELY
ncbi:MAG: glutamine synthetase [Rhodospirillaceae bacterium]|nr:glutamine synthetase [Rhodospirillaceae bacterium]